MAVAVAGNPARVGPTVGTPLASGSFDVPANSVVVVCPVVDTSGTTSTTITITNNGAALAWVPIAREGGDEVGGQPGTVAAFYAIVTGARTGLVVTQASTITGRNMTLKPYVLSGVDATDVVGAVFEGSAGPGNNVLTTTAVTAEAAGSLMFVVANESQVGPGNPTSSNATIDPYSSGGNHSGVSGYRATTTAGESVSFTVDAAGTSTAVSWNYVVFEIRPAPSGGPVSLAGGSGAAAGATGALATARPLAGTSGAAAGATGALGRGRPLTGTGGAAAGASGALSAARGLAGAAGGAAAMVGALSVLGGGQLQGASGAAAGAGGSLVADRPLAGSCGGVSSMSASLTVAGAGAGEFAGVLGGASAMVGALAVARSLAGQLAGQSGHDAALNTVSPPPPPPDPYPPRAFGWRPSLPSRLPYSRTS